MTILIKNRKIKILIVAAFLALILLVALSASKELKSDVELPSEIGNYVYYISSSAKNNFDFWMGNYDNRIYYFQRPEKTFWGTNQGFYINRIDDTVHTVYSPEKRYNSIKILGQIDQYVYILCFKNFDECELICFDMKENTDSCIYDGKYSDAATIYFTEDKELYFPLVRPCINESCEYLRVVNGVAMDDLPDEIGYPVNGSHYFMQYLGEHGAPPDLYYTTNSRDSEMISLSQARNRYIVPMYEGLIVHNEGQSDLLYYITKDEELVELFQVDCMRSKSSIATINHYIYLSMKRYEGYNDIFLKRYEDDDKEGTYLIDISDYSIKKISDIIYQSLFNLDDSCLYGLRDDGKVDQIALDGRILNTFVFPKRIQ